MGLDVRSVMVVGVLLSLLTVLLLAQVGRNFPPARRRPLRIWTVGLLLQPMVGGGRSTAGSAFAAVAATRSAARQTACRHPRREANPVDRWVPEEIGFIVGDARRRDDCCRELGNDTPDRSDRAPAHSGRRPCRAVGRR